MAQVIHVTINADKARKKLQLLQSRLKEAGGASLQDLGELGKNYARSIAPHYTGTLISLIQLQRVDSNEAIIVSKNPKSNRFWPSGGKYGGSFNLPRWMHSTKGRFQSDNPLGKAGKQHIRSGDPQYMYSTASYLRKVAPTRVQGHFNKVVAQINAI